MTEAVLGKALDGMLRRGLLRLISRRIRARQEALRKLSSPEAWKAYLAVEELANARLDAAIVRAARWGHRFASGRR